MRLADGLGRATSTRRAAGMSRMVGMRRATGMRRSACMRIVRGADGASVTTHAHHSTSNALHILCVFYKLIRYSLLETVRLLTFRYGDISFVFIRFDSLNNETQTSFNAFFQTGRELLLIFVSHPLDAWKNNTSFGFVSLGRRHLKFERVSIAKNTAELDVFRCYLSGYRFGRYFHS